MPNVRPTFVALAAAGALAGCAATYEARVERALVEAGLAPSVAGCMAERMVDRLSTAQLRALGRLAELHKESAGRMRVGEFIEQARANLDAETIEVVTRAGLGCALKG